MMVSTTVKLSDHSSSAVCPMLHPLSRPMLHLLLPCMILLLVPSVSLAQWQDWFRTPEQQAAQLLDSGDSEKLIDMAPSDSWKGLGHFQAGELDAATASFERARNIAEESGDSDAAQRELFNAATSNVHNGRLDEAINQFDELLELNPGHQRALHNKEIAEKIRAQQEQQQQQSGGDGEPGDESSDSESGEQGESQADNGRNSEQSDSSDAGDQRESSTQESTPEDGQQDGQQSNADDSADDQPQAGTEENLEENSEAAARAALEAEERLNAEAGEPEEDEPSGYAAQESNLPLTEQQQATEQWLRQIPDDPAGLLRNKLLQSHQLEYPGVQSSEERW